MISATDSCLYKGYSKLKALFLIIILCLSTLVSFGQNPQTITPAYNWISKKDLARVSGSFSFSCFCVVVNTEDIVISVATDPSGNVYNLSFGNGVEKRDSNGNILNSNFISNADLDNPLDMAIDEEGYIYVADYLASGEFFDNGKIKVFSPDGVLISNRTILTSFYRPIGLDVDEQNVYVAEFNDGNQGPESEQLSRARIYDKQNGNVIATTDQVKVPYRIGVNSKKQIYISQAGNNNPQVLVFDSTLKNPVPLDNITSPGSVVIDEFDFIHIIEYGNRIDFEQFINYQDLGAGEALALYNSIEEGIDNNEFVIKIFNSSNSLTKIIADNNSNDFNIEFPVDLTFNSCDKMYVDNVDTVNGPALDFDLEIYQRTPAFDITPPEITCTSNIVVEAQSGNNFAVVNYSEPEVTEVCDYTLSRSGLASGSQFPIGTSIIKYTATDAFGNQSDCEFSITVKEVDAPPVFDECPDDIAEENSPGNCGAIVNFQTPTATDESGSVNVEQISGPASGEFFPAGSTEVVFEARDAQDNVTTCSFNIIIDDTEAPVITCPADISETVAFGASGKVVSYNMPGQEDNCGISSFNRIEGQASGTEFPVGITANTFKVVDASGNSSICSFTVEIKEADDSEPPVINCPDPIIRNNDSGECGAIISFSLPTATDNSGDDNITITRIDSGPGSGSRFPVGETIVSYRATDEAGNSSECSFTVEVLDSELPMVNCRSDFSMTIDQDETRTLAPGDLDDGSADNCGIQSLGLSKNQFTSSDEGIVEVELTATDNNGNQAICKINVEVIVREPEKPFSCKESVELKLDENGNLEVVPSQFYDATGDISGIDFSLNRAVFSCNDLGDNRIILKYSGDFNGECEVGLIIKDDLTPAISCPQDIVKYIPKGETQAQVDFQTPSGQDNCTFTIDQTSGLSSGSQFPLGASTVEFTITDAAGNTTACSFKVIVEEESETKPVAQPDRYEVLQNNSLEVSVAEGVLMNDSDPNGDSLTAILVADVSFGTLNLNPDGSLTYVPDTDFLGMDYFSYMASDGNNNSMEVQVAINVTVAENLSPVANDDFYTTDFNTALVVPAPGVMENDSDPENEQLIAFLIEQPENGSLTFNEDGSFEYIPNNGFTGEDRFTYYVTDTAGEDEATVTISVGSANNALPVAKEDSYSTEVNTVLEVESVNGVLSNDSDPDGNDLTVILETDVSNGELQLNSDGSFRYSPDPDFIGQDYFVYYVNDGISNSNSVVVSLEVISSSDAFQCVSQIVLALNMDGQANIDIGELYTGSVEGIELNLSQEIFTCEDLGEASVQLSYSGIVDGTCEIKVQVLDASPPVLQLKDISIDLDLTGNASIDFEDINAGSYDQCSEDVVYSLSKYDYNCKDLGDNMIQVTAEDASGNTSTATVNVNVFAEAGICSDAPDKPGSDYIFIYPNPNSGSFRVATPEGVGILRMEVFDHRGRFINARDYTASDQNYFMDLGPLQEAVYVIKIITTEEEIIRRMIFKSGS